MLPVLDVEFVLIRDVDVVRASERYGFIARGISCEQNVLISESVLIRAWSAGFASNNVVGINSRKVKVLKIWTKSWLV